MEIECESLDGVLYRLYGQLKRRGSSNVGSRGGTLELLGVTLRILRPRARVSRSEDRGRLFSALGELLWYLSGSDTLAFIEPYVGPYREEAVNEVIEGAYGPRFRRMRGSIDQFDSVYDLLSRKPSSKRAVIQILNAEDVAGEHLEIPCTTTLQFLLRGGHLTLSVTMRSNDAYKGLPHDVFCFTMLQEMMARRLNVGLGEYLQYVGSMHLYTNDLAKVDPYLQEGFQQTHEMPEMPGGDPFELVPRLLAIEDSVRRGQQLDAAAETNEAYWADIVRLLQVFWAREWSLDYPEPLKQLRTQLADPFYRPYIDGRMHLAGRASGEEQTEHVAH